ncbi:MAG: hypothetical protein HAW58_02385 [Candidatus Thioglobus sp.]|nr:hypothetical protein [Candidatus Thioglobus sp.]
MQNGSSLTLTASVTPATASNPAVSWEISSAGNFASINGNILYGTAPGEVVITATADDLSGVSASQTFTITPILVSEIQIRSAAFVQDGSSLTLTAEVLPSTADNQNIIWSVENGNNSVASLNGNILTGIYPGEVTLIATAADSGGVFASQIFTVKETPVTAISISSANSVADGLILNLQARVEPAAATAQTVSWSILNGDNSIASISGVSGRYITGIFPGEVVVIASATDSSGVFATQTFSVRETPVTAISISSRNSTVHMGRRTLTADILPIIATTQTISWSILGGNNSIASISGDILTGIFPGEVVVIASADGGINITDSQTFTVRPIPVTGIRILSPDFVSHRRSLILSARIDPDNASTSTVSWSFNGDNGIVEIVGDRLTGLSHGVVTIIASANDDSGIRAIQQFTVRTIPVSSVNITNGAKIGESLTLQLSAEVLPDNASNPAISWSILGGNNHIASIDENNMIHGIGAGVVTVIASADGRRDTQRFTVVGIPDAPANLTAVANGAPNQALVFWDEVAGVSGYILYQAITDLSAYANGDIANLPAEIIVTKTEISTSSIDIDLIGTGKNYFLLTAVNDTIQSITTQQATATPHSMEFDIVNGVGAAVWMDRNLGAGQVATASDDSRSFGALYQWGRPTDGHQQRNSSTRNQISGDNRIRANHSEFITPPAEPFDWTNQDNNGSRRRDIWSQTNGDSICPTGFRVPSALELVTERNSWNTQNAAGAFASNLKLPLAELRFQGGNYSPAAGAYWSSSIDNSNNNKSLIVGLNSSTLSYLRAVGNSVRCILDSSILIKPIRNITISSTEVAEGSSLALSAEIFPADAINQNLIWSIENGDGIAARSVATLSGNTISGVGPGRVYIIATAVDGSGVIDRRQFTVTAKPAAPTKLAAVATGTPNEITVFWNGVAGARFYTLYQSSEDLARFANKNPIGLPPGTTSINTHNASVNMRLSGSEKHYFLVTANKNLNESFTSEQAVATSHSQKFIAVDGGRDRVWMDRNLGAQRVARSSTDADAFGYLYQWGRAADGHQQRNSNKRNQPARFLRAVNADFISRADIN